MPPSHPTGAQGQSTVGNTGIFAAAHLGALADHVPTDMVHENLVAICTQQRRTRRLPSMAVP